jgi:5-methylcytosine-specific restriction enzyme subunit McrC
MLSGISMNNKTISVFEYDSLTVDNCQFKQSHFDALVKFNDIHGKKYFNVGYKKITFKSYVGVLQVGDRIIEILPKGDNNPSTEGNIRKWQLALLEMLKKAGLIKLNETEKASQNISKENLLDIYLYTFLKEVEKLIHYGLVKKYRKNVDNIKLLRGRLLLNKHIQHNLIHQERFYVEHTAYDSNNIYNSIIKKALDIISSHSTSTFISTEAKKSLLYFEQIEIFRGTTISLEKLTFDRKTEQYIYAIDLARIIIDNFCPNFSSGQNHILAILFDMNLLFEKYIFTILKRYEGLYKNINLSITKQNKKNFWQGKIIKPDIKISYIINDIPYSLIIDTKWKLITADRPSDNDLKQIYVYNFMFGAKRSILLYPKTDQLNKGHINYEISDFAQNISHGCELYFANLFDENNKLSDDFVPSFFNERLTT